MTDSPPNPLRAKIDELVSRLPSSLVYSLLSEIEGMDEEPSDRVHLVRQYVIEHLNRQRTNRARRLFTSLFEAFLTDDEALYHAGITVPGVVQRIDVGALWEVLSRDAFPLLAVEAQEMLDEMARVDVIDRVLRSPVATTLKERMRASAVKHLDNVFGNRKQLEEMLAAMSRSRSRRTRLMSAFLEKTPPVDAATVQLMRTILAGAEGDIRQVAERLDAFAHHPRDDRERERMAESLQAAVDSLRGSMTEDLALLLPLTVLSAKRNYAVAALTVRLDGVDAGKGNAVTGALTGHFLGVTRALTAALSAILKLNERVPGSPIRPSARERTRLEGLMHRLGQLTEAVTISGQMEDRRTEPTFRNAWQATAKLVGSRVAAVAMERSGQAAAARQSPVIDHGDVVWLNRLLWQWQCMARDFGFETYDLVKWKETLLEELRANVEKAMKFEEGDSLDGRMEHLLRINAISSVFGHRVSAWIPTSSQNMTRLLTHRLDQGAGEGVELGGDERAIIDDLVATARAEVGKSRYWRSNELMDLIERSDKKR